MPSKAGLRLGRGDAERVGKGGHQWHALVRRTDAAVTHLYHISCSRRSKKVALAFSGGLQLGGSQERRRLRDGGSL